MNEQDVAIEQKPVKKPRKKWMGPKEREKFFKKIASRANYLNKEIVEEVYNEMVRVLTYELRKNGQAELPNLATISLSYRKPFMLKKTFYTNQPIRYNVQMPGHTIVNWRTNKNLKAYFRNKPAQDLNLKKPGPDGKLWYI